jgi:hypothetical protein
VGLLNAVRAVLPVYNGPVQIESDNDSLVIELNQNKRSKSSNEDTVEDIKMDLICKGLVTFLGYSKRGSWSSSEKGGEFQLYLRGVGWQDGGESVEDLSAAALVVDELGLRDGERDGVGARDDEADPVPGLLGWLPGLLLLGLGAATRLAAALPLRSREGADAEVHLHPVLRRLRLRRGGGEHDSCGVRRRGRGDRGNAGVGQGSGRGRREGGNAGVGGGSGRRRGEGGNGGGGGGCCFVEEA